MRQVIRLVVGAVAAVGLMAGFGCNDRSTNRDLNGTGGSGYEQSSPRLGDGKIGNNNGVIDDGEGPLEGNDGKADDKIGNQPGVWNDGEGPIESNPNLNRPSDTGKSTNVAPQDDGHLDPNSGSNVNQ